MPPLHHLTANEQLTLLRRGDLTALELVNHYLERIDRLNAGLGAFTVVTHDAARARATELDGNAARAAALFGLPSAEKDLWARSGVRTAYGSRAFANFVPDFSDEIVDVLDAAGAISLGKTSTPEFGLPAYTEPLSDQPARNPWSTNLGAGGSSGGAAVAVSAGLLPFAPGSDGGGSIRIPAAATGLVGLKPSRGRVPAGSGFGSLGQLPVTGPLARTVADAALLLDAIAGPSPYSVTPPSWDGGAYLNAAIRGEGTFSLGVMTTSPWDTTYDITIAPEATSALTHARSTLETLGHGTEELALETSDEYAAAFTVLWQASAAGIPLDGPQRDLAEPLTRWLIDSGRQLSARDVGAAIATLSRFERSVIRQFSRFDAVLTPAMAMTPRPLGWFQAENALDNFAKQVQYTPWTSFVNVAGLPAISLPVHETSQSLPMAVQLIGRPGREDVLLAIGAQLERHYRWDLRHPPAFLA
ncbi:MAG: amidase [Rhodoglobus sp.]